MKKIFAILGLLALLIPLILGGMLQAPTASAQDGENGKISSLLALQVEAKLHAGEAGEVPAGPDESRVDIVRGMQSAGMEVGDLGKQRIFIHLAQEPNQSQIAELESMGLTIYLDSWIPPVKSHPNGFITADMPVDELAALAGKDYIVRLNTAEQVLEPHNDLAVAAINADDVWTAGYDGTGVTIAVLDSGLDVTHNDIPTPTSFKDYDDWPVLDDDIANQVTGHGTHVTGSALGRGTQSGGIYKGSAPDASLVFIKIGNDTNGNASTDAMVNAIKDARDTYNADVITMSYGGWSTYHDGTSETCQAVDYAVAQGAVVFISAGNDADDDEHYSGTVSAGPGSWSPWIQITSASTGYHLYYNMVWWDGTGTSNDLELHYYNSSQVELSPVTSLGQTQSNRGTESEYSYYGSGGFITQTTAGTYYLRVKNNSSAEQFFHIYNMRSGITFNSPDLDYTIGAPAEADSAIAVGAYTTRKYWWDYKDGGGWSYTSGETVDQISTFSSRGPRVDTGGPTKPNIVAPGSAIISARDDDVLPLPSSGLPSAYAPFIDNDGPNRSNAAGGSNDGNGPADYYVNQGTSMACPIAAGVGALILEKNPAWTPAQVRYALESTATDKGDSGRDDIYGWGLIDALSAYVSSMPTAASYKDSGHTVETDLFADYDTEHIAYMYFTGLLPSYQYRVAYYDGNNDKVATDDVSSNSSGNLSSQRTFQDSPPADQAGTWHVVICERAHTPPASYNATWSYMIAEDTFTVEVSAIPEFPTALTAIVALALSAGVFLWLRRKAVMTTA